MPNDEKKEYAISLILEKTKDLGRLPTRQDFDSQTVCFIKQKLGPWPRALEIAGLKESLKPSSAERSKEKRERAKFKKKSGF